MYTLADSTSWPKRLSGTHLTFPSPPVLLSGLASFDLVGL
jgi:hypothetical protein